jgi:hypothetical protein
MARHSPGGFGFGILVEVAVIVAIVSLLPRIDLRPAMASVDAAENSTRSMPATYSDVSRSEPVTYQTEEPVVPVGWTPIDIKNGEARQATSFYARSAAASQPSDAPSGSFSTDTPAAPAIELQQPPPRYVEERLDRASQRLVNSVGSAATSAAERFLPTTTFKQSAPAKPQQARPAQAGTQHRPWLRY